jgi:hypothetical protein
MIRVPRLEVSSNLYIINHHHIHILQFPSVRPRLIFCWKEIRNCNMAQNFIILLNLSSFIFCGNWVKCCRGKNGNGMKGIGFELFCFFLFLCLFIHNYQF